MPRFVAFAIIKTRKVPFIKFVFAFRPAFIVRSISNLHPDKRVLKIIPLCFNRILLNLLPLGRSNWITTLLSDVDRVD